VLGVLLPSRCAVCDRVGLSVCDGCDGLLRSLGTTGCAKCGAPGPWPVARCAECAGRRLSFEAARAAIVYDERARALVLAWKEGGRRDLAAWAAGRIVSGIGRPPVDALVAVPGDRDRTLRRGHVTSVGLARELARRWDLPAVSCLARRPAGERQRGLTREQRSANIRDAFVVRGRVPRALCLVDDVYTTGATAGACSRALGRVGVHSIWVVTLARVVR
jgi:predicted amidophosphoribosyltransferase